MYYVYILYSESHDKYYVGHTNDVQRRLEEHNTNPRMTYTHKFGPWVLKIYFAVNKHRGDALKIERYIKRQKSRIIIERLINQSGFFYELAQLVRVPTCPYFFPTTIFAPHLNSSVFPGTVLRSVSVSP